jgi:hypothetical protein
MVKNRYSNDERVTRANGQVSEVRVLIIEALEALAGDGATAEDLFQLIGQSIDSDNPKMSIGKTLSNMDADGYVIYHRGRWYMKEHAPNAQPPVNDLHVNGLNTYSSFNGSKIAPMVQKRIAKTISLHTKPRTYTDAVAVDLLIKERWTPVPFMVNMRVMIDPEVADWPCEKWFWTDVEIVRITHKDGRKTEERPAPREIVTIAAEE